MLLDGIALAGYRSFGPSLQKIGPLRKVNLLIGPNNSGKSNVLSFLKHHYRAVLHSALGRGQPGLKFSADLDRHIGSPTDEVRVGFALNLDETGLGKLKASIPSTSQVSETILAELMVRLVTHELFTRGSQAAWFVFAADTMASQYKLREPAIDSLLDAQVLPNRQWGTLWRNLSARSGGNLEAPWIPQTIRQLCSVALQDPEIEIIPAIRRVGEGDSTESDYSGLGIIERLARLQNPKHSEQRLKQQFATINSFLRTVIDNDSATLEIPYERDMILVHLDGKTLPLASMGMGVHEVVILASAATILENTVVCIEEPELHLHPLLQKKLLSYLNNRTSNQYIISTHSAHLLDTPDAAVFHLRHEDGATCVVYAESPSTRSLICRDLGYRASDLLQSNCVIWVEGPSDRIYLRHWIGSLDDSLVEGIHYSLMFYGGRLCSHLSADDPIVEDFISLRRLNRNICIVLDSDRAGPHGRLSPTKRRLRKEFDQEPGFAWVTKGREIENYIPAATLEAGVKAVHPSAEMLVGTGQFDRALRYRRKRDWEITVADKVKVARKVTESPAELDVLDLRKMVGRLVTFIRQSNGM